MDRPIGDEGSVIVSRLDNGLTVASDTMRGSATVSFGLWVGVGTRHERAEENGVAHLLEHMMFKGTARRAARDIAVAIENVGGVINAYTAREQTAYYGKVLAADLPLGLDVLRADGGATANRFLMQFQADLLGTEVHVAAETEATALGAAALAGLGVGVWRDPADVRALIPAGTTVAPRMGRDEAAALRAAWRDALARAL